MLSSSFAFLSDTANIEKIGVSMYIHPRERENSKLNVGENGVNIICISSLSLLPTNCVFYWLFLFFNKIAFYDGKRYKIYYGNIV